MAKNDNLTDFLTGLADVIREKTDTEELINPQDFESKILSISGTKVQYIEETINGVLDELIYTVDFEPYSVLFVCNDNISAIESLMANTSVTANNLLAAKMLTFIKSNFAENQTFNLISSLYWIKDNTGVVDVNTKSSTIINFEQDETTKKWNVKISKADTSTNAYRIMSDGTYPLQIMIIGR